MSIVTPDSTQPMKPQDTVIFLLGEVKGEVSGLRQSVDASAGAQALINAANEKEHVEFRTAIAEHRLELAVFKERLPTRIPVWTVISGVVGVLSGVGVVVTLIILFTQ